METPSYLRGYEDAYGKDPRAAALQWFRDARYGLFMHYGRYSLLGRHEWVQFREEIERFPGETAYAYTPHTERAQPKGDWQ